MVDEGYPQPWFGIGQRGPGVDSPWSGELAARKRQPVGGVEQPAEFSVRRQAVHLISKKSEPLRGVRHFVQRDEREDVRVAAMKHDARGANE